MFTNSKFLKDIVNPNKHLILNNSYKPHSPKFEKRIIFDTGIEDHHDYVLGLCMRNSDEYNSWHMIYFNVEVSYDLYEAVELLYEDFEIFLNSNNFINGDVYIFKFRKQKFNGIIKYLKKYMYNVNNIKYYGAMLMKNRKII